MEKSMTRTGNSDASGAAKGSAHCGIGHDHSGHDHHDHGTSQPKAAVPEGRIDQILSNWIQLAFATPVVLWAGWPFFVRGWQSLVTRNLNMFTLIAMGTGVAYVYSLIGTVAPDIFPATFRGHA